MPALPPTNRSAAWTQSGHERACTMLLARELAQSSLPSSLAEHFVRSGEPPTRFSSLANTPQSPESISADRPELSSQRTRGPYGAVHRANAPDHVPLRCPSIVHARIPTAVALPQILPATP